MLHSARSASRGRVSLPRAAGRCKTPLRVREAGRARCWRPGAACWPFSGPAEPERFGPAAGWVCRLESTGLQRKASIIGNNVVASDRLILRRNGFGRVPRRGSYGSDGSGCGSHEQEVTKGLLRAQHRRSVQ